MIIDYSLNNGLGKPAVSIYLVGCDIPTRCKGCHNQEIWNKREGQFNIEQSIEEVIGTLKAFKPFNKDLIVSFLGGEPLAEYNRNILLELSKAVKDEFEDIKTVIYSWRTVDDIKKQGLEEYIQNIDYGVLGKFEELSYIEGQIPSSTNQMIYDFKNNKQLENIHLNKERKVNNRWNFIYQ